MMAKNFLIIAALAAGIALLYPAVATAQTQTAPMSASSTATLTAKVLAVDEANRVVTLQDSDGTTRDFQVGKNVTRFNNIKVGDTVKFAYKESVALSIVKATAGMPAVSASPVVTKYAGDKPGGEISQTQTATVVIKAIDMEKPSVTVTTQDGKTITMLVQDKNNLAGFSVGDTVRITYSQALMIQVM